jgi:hypothetical protein
VLLARKRGLQGPLAGFSGDCEGQAHTRLCGALVGFVIAYMGTA